MSLHPSVILEEVVARLRSESAQDREMLNQVRVILRSDPEFDGLSLVGGVRAVLKRYQEEKEKVFKLEQALKRVPVK